MVTGYYAKEQPLQSREQITKNLISIPRANLLVARVGSRGGVVDSLTVSLVRNSREFDS